MSALTLTFNGKPGLTVDAYEVGDGWGWEVAVGMVRVGADGCASEAEALAAGRKCARGIIQTWSAELS